MLRGYGLSIILFVHFLFPYTTSAQWNDYIVNFDKKLFGKGTQTWQIASFDETWTFFANQNGMLQYNGNSWKVIPLRNELDVRSVLASNDNKRIYAGGINEFGYFEPSITGELEYHCMSDSLPFNDRYFGNVWGIHMIDNILYFHADGQIIKHINNKYEFISTNSPINCSSVINNTLYLATEKGLFVVVGNTLFPVQGAETLSGKRIKGIEPYQSGILIATAYDGLFYLENNILTPFNTGAESLLMENEVFCMDTHGDLVALGTIRKGIILYDAKSGTLKYYNENTGLQNNTVLSVSFDKIGNLWCGMDISIGYISLNSAFSNLYSYPYSYGKGYTAVVEGDRLYLGTNRGLFYTDYPVKIEGDVPNIKPVNGSSGQVWNLCRVGNDLFCLHDRGVFLLTQSGIERIGDINGTWTCLESIDDPNRMYVGTYGGIYIFNKENGVWKQGSKIEGFNDSSRFIVEESPGILWISVSDNLARIKLSKDYRRVNSVKKYNVVAEKPNHKQINLSKIEDEITFATSEGIYRYDITNDTITPSIKHNQQLNGSAGYICVQQNKDKLISLSQNEICFANIKDYKQGGNIKSTAIHPSLLELVQGFETFIPISETQLIIPNENGFSLFCMPINKDRKDFDHAIFIQNMYLTYPKDSLIYTANYLNQKHKPVISYANNSIRFEYGQSLYSIGDNIEYQYRLNKGDWSESTPVNTKEFSNLFEGDYLFEIKSHYPDGTVLYDEIEFTIQRPWYRSIAAYIFYIIALSLAVTLLIYIEDKRFKNKKAQLETEKQKELHQIEKFYEAEKEKQEQHIIQLEKEKLEYDLKHKSQEIANLMINFLRKNEMLTEIKSEIIKVSASLKGESGKEGKKQLMILNNKIDSNIKNDEVLERIEEEFDLIHNNFIQRLTCKHPNLSLNERIMCTYLKMNLSTKEIAALLNISVRGVETLRYRLRKKLNLEREDNLIDYLSNRL